jgi:hypothetical protein
MLQKLRDLDPLIHIVLIICIIILFVSLYNLQNKVKDFPLDKTSVNTANVIASPGANSLTESKVAKMISDAFNKSTASPKQTTITTKTNTQTSVTTPRTSYIPMGSTFVTTSQDWVSVPDSEVYIDVENDYGKNAYITFEASLKVANGNGQADIRLYDATHGISNGSELYTQDNSDFVYIHTDKLNLWEGRNLYKVQVKSLNGFEVTVSNAKIKVTY